MIIPLILGAAVAGAYYLSERDAKSGKEPRPKVPKAETPDAAYARGKAEGAAELKAQLASESKAKAKIQAKVDAEVAAALARKQAESAEGTDNAN